MLEMMYWGVGWGGYPILPDHPHPTVGNPGVCVRKCANYKCNLGGRGLAHLHVFAYLQTTIYSIIQ